MTVLRQLAVILPAFIVAFLGFVAFAFYYGPLQPLAIRTIQNIISDQLPIRVEIEEIQGNLITETSFKGITIFPDSSPEDSIHIESADIHYNPFYLLHRGGNALEAASSIILDGVKLTLTRDSQGVWNYQLPSRKKQQEPKHTIDPFLSEEAPPIPFSGLVIVRNLDLHFKDSRGWFERPLDSTFDETLQGVNLSVDFNYLSEIQFKVVSPSGNYNLAVHGMFNAYNQKFSLDFEGDHFDLDHWSPYFIPAPEVGLSGGSANLNGKIVSKTPTPLSTIPFRYLIDIELNHGNIHVPYPEKPFVGTGSASIGNGVYFLEEKSNLLSRSIIDSSGMIQGDLPDSIPGISDKTMQYLRQPPTTLVVHQFEGSLQSVPISVTGNIDITNGELFIKGFSPRVDLAVLDGLIPELETFNLYGQGQASMSLSGLFSRPLFTGDLVGTTGTFLDIPFENSHIGFQYFDNHVNLNLIDGRFYNGNLNGALETDISYDAPIFDFNGTIQDISAQTLFPTLPSQGKIDAEVSVSGNADNFNLAIHTQSDSFKLYNQLLPTTEFHLNFTPDVTTIDNSFIEVNTPNSRLIITGSFTDSEYHSIKVTGEKISVADIDGVSQPERFGAGTLSAEAKGPIETNFIDALFSTLEWKGKAQFKKQPFYQQLLNLADIEFSYDGNDLIFDRLYASESQGGSLIGSGVYTNETFSALEFDAQYFPLFENSLIQAMIPAEAQPLTGDVSGTFSYRNTDSLYLKGKLLLTNGVSAYQPFDSIKMQFDTIDSKLVISSSEFKVNDSSVYLEGTYSDKNLAITFQKPTFINLLDFNPWLSPYGDFSGSLELNGTYSKTPETSSFSIQVDGHHLNSDLVRIDQAEGRVGFNNNTVSLEDVNLTYNDDVLLLNGFMDITPILEEQDILIDQYNFQLDLRTDSAELANIVSLFESFYQEYLFRSQDKKLSSIRESSPNLNQTVSANQDYQFGSSTHTENQRKLFDLNAKNDELGYYFSIRDQHFVKDNIQSFNLQQYVDGSFSGNFFIQTDPGKTPEIISDLTFDDARLFFLDTKNGQLSFSSKDNTIGYKFNFRNGSIKNLPFDTLSSKGNYDYGELHIEETTYSYRNIANNNLLTGSIPLGGLWDSSLANLPLNATFMFRDNDLGLLSLLMPFTESLSAKGTFQLKLTGSLDKPIFNTPPTTISDVRIKWADDVIFTSMLEIPTLNFMISNNVFTHDRTLFTWQGNDTLPLYTTVPQKNNLYIQSRLELVEPSLLLPDSFYLNIQSTIEPATVALNLDGIYRGKVKMANTQIKGIYEIPLSASAIRDYEETLFTDNEKGPLISTSFRLMEGQITLPDVSDSEPLPSFMLDSQGEIGNGVIIVGSVFGESFLAGLANSLELSVRQTATPLHITGTLNSPVIENSLTLSDGEINILNNTFDIIEPNTQRIYFQDAPFKVLDNSVSFETIQSLDTGKLSLEPQLHIVSLSILEPINTSVSSNITTETLDTNFTPIVFRIDGSVFDLRSFSFDHFESADDTITSPDELTFINTYQLSYGIAGGSANDADTLAIVKLLVGLQDVENSAETIGTSHVIQGSFANQINFALRRQLLRPIEKRIAENIGLYDFRVNYNMGNALLSGAGLEDVSQEDNIRLSAVAQLIDKKAFLKVKSDIDVSAESNKSSVLHLSEVELSYLVRNNLSINFTNTQDKEEQFVVEPKFSLKYSYEF